VKISKHHRMSYFSYWKVINVRLITEIISEFGPKCSTLEEEAQSCDTLILKCQSKELPSILETIEELKRTVSQTYNQLDTSMTLLEKLISSHLLDTNVCEDFENLKSGLEVVKSKLEHSQDILFRLNRKYSSRLMNDMEESIEISDQYLSIIFMISMSMVPFQIIASTFGMNVPIPWYQTNELTPFFIITAFCYGMLIFVLIVPMILGCCFDRKSKPRK
jgi:Mg2+ and Co2+ transporter CorA